MTTGQLVFYSGLALLGLTIITAIIFLIKKPKYMPENVVNEKVGGRRTQRRQNGYPTEREAIHRSGSLAETELIDAEEVETAAGFPEDGGETILPTEKIDL